MSLETNSNPYEREGQELHDEFNGVDDEVIRNRFICAEVRIVAVGWFYYCMSAFQLTMVIGIFLFVDFEKVQLIELAIVLLIVIAVLFAIIGYGMRNFIEWARRPSIVAAAVGMCMFPAGTLAGIYCILLLRKSMVEEIFTDRYRAMVKRENYKSLGWLAFVTGILMAVSFWGMFFLLAQYAIDWRELEQFLQRFQ